MCSEPWISSMYPISEISRGPTHGGFTVQAGESHERRKCEHVGKQEYKGQHYHQNSVISVRVGCTTAITNTHRGNELQKRGMCCVRLGWRKYWKYTREDWCGCDSELSELWSGWMGKVWCSEMGCHGHMMRMNENDFVKRIWGQHRGRVSGGNHQWKISIECMSGCWRESWQARDCVCCQGVPEQRKLETLLVVLLPHWGKFLWDSRALERWTDG